MSIYLQYQNSTNLTKYIQNIENSLLIDVIEFYDTYFNILTCETAGLDNWGLILNRPRTVYSSGSSSYMNKMGFSEGTTPSPTGNYPQNFYNSNFPSSVTVQPLQLDNPEYRQLLLFYYLNTITNATLATINANLNYYYNPSGTNGKQVAVTNTAPMQLTYNFNFPLQSYEIILFNTPNVLPTPICVSQILVYP